MVYPELQDVELFFHSLAALKKSKPELTENLEFRYFGPNHQLMDRLADAHNLAPLIVSSEPVAREVALDEQEQADILVFFSFEFPGCLSGKIFEYIGAGKSILALGPQNQETTELLEECGQKAGILSDANAIADAISDSLSEWKKQGSIAFIPSGNRDQYTRKAQAEVLNDILHKELR